MSAKPVSARQIVLSGQVQGVGFRPFIYRLAVENNLTGWVKNCLGIVEIRIQGDPQKALIDPNSIVLTRELAEKYFGKEKRDGRFLADGYRSETNTVFQLDGCFRVI